MPNANFGVINYTLNTTTNTRSFYSPQSGVSMRLPFGCGRNWEGEEGGKLPQFELCCLAD